MDKIRNKSKQKRSKPWLIKLLQMKKFFSILWKMNLSICLKQLSWEHLKAPLRLSNLFLILFLIPHLKTLFTVILRHFEKLEKRTNGTAMSISVLSVKWWSPVSGGSACSHKHHGRPVSIESQKLENQYRLMRRKGCTLNRRCGSSSIAAWLAKDRTKCGLCEVAHPSPTTRNPEYAPTSYTRGPFPTEARKGLTLRVARDTKYRGMGMFFYSVKSHETLPNRTLKPPKVSNRTSEFGQKSLNTRAFYVRSVI